MLPLGILFDLLTFPVMGPIKGLEFIARQLQKQVDQEVFSPKNIEHELLELQMLHEIGEIPDEEFTRRENELLDRLDELMLAKGVLQDVEEEQEKESKQEKERKQEEKDKEQKEIKELDIPTPRAS